MILAGKAGAEQILRDGSCGNSNVFTGRRLPTPLISQYFETIPLLRHNYVSPKKQLQQLVSVCNGRQAISVSVKPVQRHPCCLGGPVTHLCCRMAPRKRYRRSGAGSSFCTASSRCPHRLEVKREAVCSRSMSNSSCGEKGEFNHTSVTRRPPLANT